MQLSSYIGRRHRESERFASGVVIWAEIALRFPPIVETLLRFSGVEVFREGGGGGSCSCKEEKKIESLEKRMFSLFSQFK